MSVTSALRECHRLRVHLRDLQAEIDRGPRVMQEYQDELDAARQAHKAHFDTITQLKERTAAIPSVEEKWKAAQAEFAEFQKEAAERLERMQADTEASRAELARVEATIPPDVKSTYDSIVKAKGPDAFAAAKNRVCQGCRTTMAELHFSELRWGTFRTCITCGRMLYPVE